MVFDCFCSENSSPKECSEEIKKIMTSPEEVCSSKYPKGKEREECIKTATFFSDFSRKLWEVGK
jgi:hypothetical protein